MLKGKPAPYSILENKSYYVYISFHNLVNTVIINNYHHPLMKTDSQLLNNLVSSSTHAQSHSFKSPLGYFHTSPSSQFKCIKMYSQMASVHI